MGAKTWMLVYSTGEVADILKAQPLLDRAATISFVGRLFPGEHLVEAGDGDLSLTCPDDDEIVAACFNGVTIVAAKEFRVERPSALDARFVQALPGHTLTLHTMVSTIDWFACAIWHDGKLQRSLSLAPDDGVLEDIGDKMPFELPYWDGQHPTFEPEEEGEEGEQDGGYPFVFHPLELGEAALQALFGYQLEGCIDPQQVPVDKITLMRFKRKAPWWKIDAPA